MGESPRGNQTLIGKIEEAAHYKDINVGILVREYGDQYSDKPVLCLVQDLTDRIGVYRNILEEIKKLAPQNRTGPDSYDIDANDIKIKYEALGLVPANNLPNPTATSVINYVLDKINSFGRALVEVMARYAVELRRESHIDRSATLHLDVELGWPMEFTIGVEATAGRAG